MIFESLKLSCVKYHHGVQKVSLGRFYGKMLLTPALRRQSIAMTASISSAPCASSTQAVLLAMVTEVVVKFLGPIRTGCGHPNALNDFRSSPARVRLLSKCGKARMIKSIMSVISDELGSTEHEKSIARMFYLEEQSQNNLS